MNDTSVTRSSRPIEEGEEVVSILLLATPDLRPLVLLSNPFTSIELDVLEQRLEIKRDWIACVPGVASHLRWQQR